jgi:hypothetical protein
LDAEARDAALADVAVRYEAAKGRLAGLGFAVAGSVAARRTTCGKRSCACHTDPARRHGPYWQYTRKERGKTVGRHLDAAQAALYQEWTANRRELDEVTAEMDSLSHEAAELLTGRG